jgi:hypothetical protein
MSAAAEAISDIPDTTTIAQKRQAMFIGGSWFMPFSYHKRIVTQPLTS